VSDGSLHSRWCKVALQLALLPNGAVARMDSNGGGGYYSDRIPTAGEPHGALDLLEERYIPHLRWAARWREARDDDERERVVELAERDLSHARKSRGGRPTHAETRAERDRRIVEFGEGLAAREVAIAARCGLRDVIAARRDAGREEQWGRRFAEATNLSAEERRVRVAAAAAAGLNAKQISRALGVPYITIRRDLERPPL
jgi:hypothetical protein